ncbi:MAG: MGMT family protein [Balneolaceae bacterium]
MTTDKQQRRDDFYRRVYRIVAEIPPGRVTTYGAIARYLGVGSGARMVGYALNNLAGNETEGDVPAHRVVNRLGQLTGRSWFQGNSMKEKLEQEGVGFTDEFQIDIRKYFWDPANLREKDPPFDEDL